MRVRAHNVHGWSEWSPILIIKSTGLPLKPDPPTTSIANGYAIMKWADPYANYEALDSYQILFAHQDYVNYSEITLYCDGTDVTVINAKQC